MRWAVAAAVAALAIEDAVARPAIRDPFMSVVDLLPAPVVEAAYAAAARGLHLAVGISAALMLATALAMAALLRRRASIPDACAQAPRRDRSKRVRDADGSDGVVSARTARDLPSRGHTAAQSGKRHRRVAI